MWGTTGIGYNVKDVKDLLGSDAKINSWDYVFNPDKIKKFTDCGIHLLNSSDDIMSAGLHYLHLDPNTSDPGRPAKSHGPADAHPALRAQIPFLGISQCARHRRNLLSPSAFPATSSRRSGAPLDAKGGVGIGYSIPKEGAQLWFDNLAIPKDAPHPQEAHELIDYLIKPEVAAKNTNYVWYANGDRPSQFIDPSILDDLTIYPDAATMANFYTIIAHDAKTQRLINRLWTRIKTGE